VSNNPALAAAREDIAAAEASRRATSGARLPQVSGDASTSYGGRETGAPGGSYSYGLSARQLVIDSGRQGAADGRAEQAVLQSRIAYKQASADLRWRLRTAFVELLQAQDLVGMTSDILERRRQTTRLIGVRYDAGREHRGALLTAEAKEAQAQADTEQARRALELARMALRVEVGVRDRPTFEAVGAMGGVAPGAARPDLDALAAGVPAVRQAEFKTETARLGVVGARAERFPDLSATARAGRSGAEGTAEEGTWSAGIGLSVPLWRGGATRAGTVAALAAWRRSGQEERAARDSAVANLASRWAAWQNARDAEGVQRKFLSAAEERARISEAQYEAGLLAFDNWIIIEDEYVQARRGLLAAQAAAMGAEADWTRAIGGTLEDEIP
jgi:outer membrane protein TolC